MLCLLDRKTGVRNGVKHKALSLHFCVILSPFAYLVKENWMRGNMNGWTPFRGICGAAGACHTELTTTKMGAKRDDVLVSTTTTTTKKTMSVNCGVNRETGAGFLNFSKHPRNC